MKKIKNLVSLIMIPLFIGFVCGSVIFSLIGINHNTENFEKIKILEDSISNIYLQQRVDMLQINRYDTLVITNINNKTLLYKLSK